MSACFISVLSRYNDAISGRKTRLHILARAAMSFFDGNDLHDFVIQILKNNIFQVSRLHTLFVLKYYNVDAIVLLDNVVGGSSDGNTVDAVARNFAPGEISRVMRVAASFINDFPGILAKMKATEVFQGNYNPAGAAERWTISRVWKLIAMLHRKTNVPIPEAVFRLRALYATEEDLKFFFNGEAEVADVANHLVALSGDDDALYAEVIGNVARQSAPLAKFMARRRSCDYTSYADASSYEPNCNNRNSRLHRLAVGESRIMVLPSDVSDFRRCVRESRFIAVTSRLSAVTGAEQTDFITFRTKKKSFHFSSNLSHSVLADVRNILSSETGHITVFAFQAEDLMESLRKRFNWPNEYVDAAAFVEESAPKLTMIAEAFAGEPFCRRACAFSDASTPSQVALKHCDMHATLIYEFCVEWGNYRGEEMRFAVAYHDANPSPSRPRERRDDPPSSSRRRRSRSKSRGARSRSRSRHR